MKHVIDVDAASALAICFGIIAISKNLIERNVALDGFIKPYYARPRELKRMARPVFS